MLALVSLDKLHVQDNQCENLEETKSYFKSFFLSSSGTSAPCLKSSLVGGLESLHAKGFHG